jgi:predicted SAM-dependent methyltransferase
MDRDQTPNLLERIRGREFEFQVSFPKVLFYWLERELGHRFFRKAPPPFPSPRFLNLGCGPQCFPGWINADDYAFKRQWRDRKFRPNWRLDITRPWKCESNWWDGIFTEHVIEHLTYSEAVHVFSECLRSLKPGGWLRVSVPDLAKYVRLYSDQKVEPFFQSFPNPALAVSFVTQMHIHRSTWDGKLMISVLEGVGFENVSLVSFRQGSDERLLMDEPSKKVESLYVEARKPL